MPEVKNDEQTSSRQPSSLAGDVDLSPITLPISQAPSFSPSSPPTEKVHTSWLKHWSSVTPLICGGLGPAVTLMALSGCADKWRTKTVDGNVIVEEDPIWVMATTAVAIVIGFVANIFLLMRMVGRGNPKHMQYWSITLWTVESVINFATVGVYVQIVGNDDGWTYAQGFWMTVCSAGMSSICAFLLSLNSFVLPAFGKRGKMGLTGPQRVFVIQIMFFIFWLAVGAAVFHGVEHFTFSESVFFVDLTVTTVGFGNDVVPKTVLGQALTMPYAIIGIISLGFVVSSIRTVVVERAHIRKLLIDAIMKREEKRLEYLRRRVRLRHASVMGVSLMVMGHHTQEIHDRSVEPYIEMIAREELRESRLLSAEKWEEVYALTLSLFVFAIFWLAGAAIFSHTERWTYFQGLYFCMVFFLTIGYGDFFVTSNAGRAIYIVYSLLTIPVMTILISLMSDTFLSEFQKRAERFGVKGEDGYYEDIVAQSHEKNPPLKIFRQKGKKPGIETDIEQGDVIPTTGDEILREEVMEEVESIREEVNEEVDTELHINKKDIAMVEKEMSEAKGIDTPRLQNQDEDINDQRVTEEDDEPVMRGNREKGH